MSISRNETRVAVRAGYAQLWTARGLGDEEYYPTKIIVEAELRARFPNETEDQRYARIYFDEFGLL